MDVVIHFKNSQYSNGYVLWAHEITSYYVFSLHMRRTSNRCFDHWWVFGFDSWLCVSDKPVSVFICCQFFNFLGLVALTCIHFIYLFILLFYIYLLFYFHPCIFDTLIVFIIDKTLSSSTRQNIAELKLIYTHIL
jgi:hypothetical protein